MHQGIMMGQTDAETAGPGLREVENHDIVITRHGKPAGVLTPEAAITIGFQPPSWSLPVMT